ncbi:hypothetical protein TCAL_02052 [Tigriopus californicus]|uniref:E3 SUMO-protein ligase NSE2 n=1 Tax=Tigriopus californicus TaxID=6832 RepID=A0A553NCW0_TIGCA|nr:E3 SUMO-protein ligase NSE2-like [Tigriopus californicus]TRY63286.1 hypothetical protein TCAL_02052 [Tigriopus californicus]|eukprot:TCALIF_02052-PA protein Name:"Similar to nsmce2 E3 SUMO-protein ligase NSE2 (Xenopus laevis)" AED:0.04 eAED:0.06 QI:0/-1/0/1/-1/1/1/0/229
MNPPLPSQGGSDKQLDYLKSGMDINCGVALSLVSRILQSDPERSRAVQSLREGLSDYIRQEQDYKDSMEALRGLWHQVAQQVDQGDFSQVHEIDQTFAAVKERLAGPVTEIEIAKHPMIVQFELRAQNVCQGLEASQMEAGSGHSEDQDDDLETTLVSGDHRDPFTRKKLVHPVQNVLCGHNYERDTIFELIKTSSRTKCPISGCRNTQVIVANHLKADCKLKRLLAAD